MQSTLPEDAVERRLRLRRRFWAHRTIIALIFVLALLAGAWVSYGTYAAPGETTDEHLESRWVVTGEFDHQAEVTDSEAAFPDESVRTDEPVYYPAVSPTAVGTFVSGYDADSSEDVTVSLTVDVHYRAVDGDDDLVYWSDSERLATENQSGVEPGEEVPVTFDLEVAAIGERIEDIEDELEASPGDHEIVLEIDREVDGTIDGDEQFVSDAVTIPLEYDGNTYAFDDEQDFEAVYEEYRTETTTVSYGPARTVGGPVLGLLGIVGVAGVTFASRRLPQLTANERAWLEYRTDRETFDEIITQTALPPSAIDGERAEVDSLASLAEFGIDVGDALLYDEQTGQYMVRCDDLHYVYEPPSVDGDRNTVGPLERIRQGSVESVDLPEVQLTPSRDTVSSTERVASKAGDPGDDASVGSDADDAGDTASTQAESDEHPESDRSDSLEFPSDSE